jgi:folate-binding protein YgfZ
MIHALEQRVNTSDYTALVHGSAVQARPDYGLLAVSDADRSDFLHRMTTNNINALKPGQSCVTVLTSPTARTLFVFAVICRSDELWLLPAAGQALALERHLRGQIFFMDKVKVRNLSNDFARLRVMGSSASVDEVVAALGVDLRQSPEGSWQEQAGVLAVKQTLYDLPGYALIVAAERQPSVLDALQAAGAVALADNSAYHARRVELGRPLPGAELTEEYNPLESGLAWACADNKGCYTGQEIIARQITYDKVTKTLAGVRSEQLLAPGANLHADGRAVGTVTSAAYSPALDAPIALAIVKRPHNAPGTELTVDELLAQVMSLPIVP